MVRKAIYLGGKWSDKANIRKKMDELESMDFAITHDWTSFEKLLDGPEKMEYSAMNDIKGVQNCDIMIAYMNDPEYAYRGTFTEIGCALGLEKQVVIVCPYLKEEDVGYCKSNCFFHHPDIKHVVNWTECLNYLDELDNMVEMDVNND